MVASRPQSKQLVRTPEPCLPKGKGTFISSDYKTVKWKRDLRLLLTKMAIPSRLCVASSLTFMEAAINNTSKETLSFWWGTSVSGMRRRHRDVCALHLMIADRVRWAQPYQHLLRWDHVKYVSLSPKSPVNHRRLKILSKKISRNQAICHWWVRRK